MGVPSSRLNRFGAVRLSRTCKCGRPTLRTVRRAGVVRCVQCVAEERWAQRKMGERPPRACDYCGAATVHLDESGGPACGQGHGCMVSARRRAQEKRT